MTSLLDHALSYAHRGWSVVPIKPGEKRPSVDWQKFQTRRATDAEIETWCADPSLTAIALVLGPISGGIYARDFDVGDSYDEWAAEYPEYARSLPTVKTGKGAHVYATMPLDSGLKGIEVYRDGELRVSGGIVLLPPSLHPSGIRYKWIIPLTDHPPLEIDPREIGLIGQAPIKRQSKSTETPDVIPSGQRNNVLTSLAGTMRKRGMSEESIAAALQSENLKRCRPPLDESEVSTIARSVAQYDPEKASGKTSAPIIIRMSDVAPQDVHWLWEPYIPLGKMTLLEGDPKVGKSFLAIQIAAIVSRGWGFPNGDGKPHGSRDKANVVYMNAEDGLADTVRVRLDKADADVNRVYCVRSVRVREGAKIEDRMITMQDVHELDHVLSEVQPELLIIDPVQAYLGKKVDINKANEVRSVLTPIADLAERHQCAIVCIRHLSKSTQSKAMYRGLGTIDFSAAARSIIRADRDKDNPAQRMIVHVACSNAPEGPTLGYELADGFTWTGVINTTADDLDQPETTDRDSAAVGKAIEFLETQLGSGSELAVVVKKQARRARISEWSLRKAKSKLGIRDERIGTNSEWVWRLPNDR